MSDIEQRQDPPQLFSDEGAGEPRRNWLPVLLLPARAALTLLIVWQALFLVLSNLAAYVKDAENDGYWTWKYLQPSNPEWKKRIDLWNRIENKLANRSWEKLDDLEKEVAHADRLDRFYYHTRELMDRWERLAGQRQGWSLFAPTIADWSCFVAVELRWDDDKLSHERLKKAGVEIDPARKPVLLLSVNEPADITSYFRTSYFRLRRFESNLEVCLRLHGRTVKEAARGNPSKDEEGWATRIRNKVWRERKEIHAYLRWRTRRYLKEHPGTPTPTQVRLLVRNWTICAPDGPTPFRWRWHEAEQNVPMARWLPWHKKPRYPVEYYDPLEERFEEY